jgi:hypothetical protein
MWLGLPFGSFSHRINSTHITTHLNFCPLLQGMNSATHVNEEGDKNLNVL